jgi:uncharacterized membrane protein
MWFLSALLAATFYALVWILARVSRGIPSAVVTAAQFIIGPLLLLSAVQTVDYPWGEWWFHSYLLFPFILDPFFMWAMTKALHRIEVTTVKPLFGISSITALVVAVLFFGRTISPIGALGIGIVTIGLFSLYHGRLAIWKRWSPWIVLLSAIFFGVNAAVVAEVLERFPHIFALLALSFTGIFMGLLPFAIRDLRNTPWNGRTLAILSTILLANVGQDAFTYLGLSLGPSPYVIAVKRLSILFTALIGYVFLKERDQSLPRLLFACVLVIFGLVFITIG